MSEATRLAAVESLQLFGTAAESSFDRLAQLAAAALDAPVAMISIVGEASLWRKARVGDVAIEVPRQGSFCWQTVEARRLLVIGDARRDPRFECLFQTSRDGLRFHAGAPIRLPGGEVVGALCVADTRPREGLAPSALIQLDGLAATVGHLFDFRREVAAEREAQRRLSEQARRLAFVERIAGLATWRFDYRSGTLRQSENVRRIYGLRINDPIDCTDTILALYDPADRSRVIEAVDEAMATGTGYVLDVRLQRASDGARRVVRIRARVERDAGGQPVALVGVLQDVTSDKEMLKQMHGRCVASDRVADEMRHLATVDVLTGLPNRRAFLEAAGTALARGGPVELVVIDIDHFKLVNDRHGHSGGDLVLSEFGRILAAVADPTLVGRIGGEEFAMLLEGARPGEAARLVEALRSTLSAGPLLIEGDFSIALTVSAGLARSCRSDDWSSLFGRADRALYRAKRDGRDRLTVAA